MTMNTVEEIIDYAIAREQEAVDFYTKLAEMADSPGIQLAFSQYAQEEMGHKKKLQGIKEGKRLRPSHGKVIDLKISDYTVDVEFSEDMTYQQCLLLAMKREKAAFRLYMDLANKAADQEMKLTFTALAQEEAKHKLRFEVEYDEVILVEN